MAPGDSTLITQERLPDYCWRNQEDFDPASHRSVGLNHKQYQCRQIKHNLLGQKKYKEKLSYPLVKKIWHSSVLDIVCCFLEIFLCVRCSYLCFPYNKDVAWCFKKSRQLESLIFQMWFSYMFDWLPQPTELDEYWCSCQYWEIQFNYFYWIQWELP